MSLNICSNTSVVVSVMDMTLGAESEGRRFEFHFGKKFNKHFSFQGKYCCKFHDSYIFSFLHKSEAIISRGPLYELSRDVISNNVAF